MMRHAPPVGLPRCALCHGERWRLDARLTVQLECQQCGILVPATPFVHA